MCALSQSLCHGTCHLDAAAHGHKVHVAAGAIQEDVPHVSPHDVALASQGISNVAHQFHDRQINVFGYFLTVYIHDFAF